MIVYSPINGDPLTKNISYRPRTAFIMTKLGDNIPESVLKIRANVERICIKRQFGVLDASSLTTGRDFLDKIWNMILSVPLGIAIIVEEMNTNTVANIYYELGLLQAYGKETIVIKTPTAQVPSDLVRTEYIEFDENTFDGRMSRYLDYILSIPDDYDLMSTQLENNPLLSIDYLKRAYLISGDEDYKRRVKEIIDSSNELMNRSKNSVELLMSSL